MSPNSIKKGINFFNAKFNTSYKDITEIESETGSIQNDRIIEKLTRMKKEARETCMFYSGLEKDDVSIIKQVPKADLHAHSTRSGSRSYFEEKYEVITDNRTKFGSIKDMNSWYDENIKVLFSSKQDSFEERLRSAFIAAEEDGIKTLMLSFGTGNLEVFNGNIDKYIGKIEEIRKGNYTGAFIPELCLVRGNRQDDLYREIIDKDYFRSLDLVGNERLGVDDYIDIFKYAKDHGMILRCHVGEFESSNFVAEAVKKLNLDEIQHGLSMVRDKDLMRRVKEQGIQVNLCPASNYSLGRVKTYSYPLRILLDNGIKVTINTDDLLLFNKPISEIYLDLYKTGLFTKEELNEIRNNGLNYKTYFKSK